MKRPLIYGILNLTPDSFSDGGSYLSVQQALEAAHQLVTDGADVLDIGGESTRPGAPEVPVNAEIDRILPIVIALRKTLPELRLSIDTRKSQVAKVALEAGAHIINDVSGLRFDPELANVTAQFPEAELIITHSRGTPETMQLDSGLLQYADVTATVLEFWHEAISQALESGIRREKLIMDPGFGFAKTFEQNWELVRRFKELTAIELPIMAGISRKRFLGAAINEDNPRARDAVTHTIEALLSIRGAQLVRTHDVCGFVREWHVLELASAFVEEQR